MSAPGGEPIPARPPRSPLVHLGVDVLVAACALFIVGVLLGWSLGRILAIALVAGVAATPVTLAVERRGLAARAAARRDEPGGGSPDAAST